MELAADGQPEINELGPEFFPGLRPESRFDLFESGHALGVAGHKFIKRGVVNGYHVPQGMRKIIRPPPELIGIIQAVGYQDTFS